MVVQMYYGMGIGNCVAWVFFLVRQLMLGGPENFYVYVLYFVWFLHAHLNK